MRTICLLWAASAALVRSVESSGTVAEAETRALTRSEAQSLRHSVCGKSHDRATPFSTDFETFSARYADKVSKLKAAVKEMQEAVAGRKDFWGPAGRVKDRMEAFLKCKEVNLQKFPDENIPMQIINAHRTGYLAMARWAAAHVLGEMTRVLDTEIEGGKPGCQLDGSHLEFVVAGRPSDMRATIGGESIKAAIDYIFQPAGCMEASTEISRTAQIKVKDPAYQRKAVALLTMPNGMPSIYILAFDSVREAFNEGFEQLETGGLLTLLKEAKQQGEAQAVADLDHVSAELNSPQLEDQYAADPEFRAIMNGEALEDGDEGVEDGDEDPYLKVAPEAELEDEDGPYGFPPGTVGADGETEDWL